jgi:hypothetical protein
LILTSGEFKLQGIDSNLFYLMSKNIQILKRSTVAVPHISSYKLVLEAVNAENMPNKIFVNQRITNFAKGTIDDSFAAVCTPVQLEDFPEDQPEAGSSYYRTNVIEVVVRTPEMLQTAIESILYEVKKLVIDLEDLDNLTKPTLYNVNPSIEISQIVALPVAEFAALTSSQLTALSKYEISALLNTQLAALSTAQIRLLTADQVNALTANQVGSLQTDMISSLSASQVMSLAPIAVTGLKTSQLAIMSLTQIDALTTRQIGVLSAAQIIGLQTEVFPTLTNAQVAAMTPSAINGLTSAGISALTTAQLAAMQTEDIAAISPSAIFNLSTDKLSAFTTQGLAAFRLVQVAALTSTQLQSLTTDQQAALPTAPAPSPASIPTFWIPRTKAAGNVSDIADLSNFANNYVRSNIGDAASWDINPYSFPWEGQTYFDNHGVLFTLDKVNQVRSRATLTFVYTNDASNPTRRGIDAQGYQYPYIYVRHLIGAVEGYFSVKWNGQTVAYIDSNVDPKDMDVDYVYEYYPDDPANFGVGGRLAAGESTAMVVEIEAAGSATNISGDIFFGYYL